MTAKVLKYISKESFENFPCREKNVQDRIPHSEAVEEYIRYLTYSGDPVAVLCLTKHEDCLEAHAMVSEKVKSHKAFFHETVRFCLKDAFKVYPSHDLIIMDVDPLNEEWANRLGFSKLKKDLGFEEIPGYLTFGLRRGDL